MTLRHQQELLGRQLQWQLAEPTSPPSLNFNELHVWQVPLKLTSSQHKIALDLLNDTQRDKYHRRATPALQHTYLAGRYYLMVLLAGYNCVTCDQILISYSQLNKPYLNPNPLDIQFNFTDTLCHDSEVDKAVGLLAFTRSIAVGVDIESLARRSNFRAIVAKRFSEAETDYVTETNGEINPGRFLAYWTRKEAYGKATGQGINFKMREMDLASAGSFDLEFCAADTEQRAYRLQQFQIDDDFVAAIVHQDNGELHTRAFKYVPRAIEPG